MNSMSGVYNRGGGGYGGSGMNQFSSGSSQYGQNSFGGGGYGQNSGGMQGGFGGGQSFGGGLGTSALLSQNAGMVQALQNGMLQNFGGSMSFMGKIETLSAPMSASAVEQVLSSQGQGQVLVVDAGGPLSNCGVFDMSMVQKAQMNGWAGVVINGAVVGADMLRNSPIGILAAGVSQMRCQNNSGHKGGMLNFANVNFSRGSYIYADKDGTVVSQQEVSRGQFGSGGGMGSSGSMGTGMGSFNSGSNFGNSMSQTQGFNSYNNNQGMGGGSSSYGGNQQMGGAGSSSYGGGGFNSGYGGAGGSSSFGGGGVRPQYNSYQKGGYGGMSGMSNSYNRGSSYGNSYSSFNSYKKRKRPSKRTIMGGLLFVLAIVWCSCAAE